MGKDTQTRLKIAPDILLPIVLSVRAEKKSDPEKWTTSDYESIKGRCGPEFAHVPIDDVRLQACNMRKAGKLGRISGTARPKLGPVNPEYAKYLASDFWRNRRQWFLEFWKHACCLCKSQEGLNVHHNTYENLGNEETSDCVVLCRHCHKQFEERRKRWEREQVSSLFANE